MTRNEVIEKLKELAPIVTEVTLSFDMGFEFCAVVPSGVIYAIPGMLINHSGGAWPPDQWIEDHSEEHCQALLKELLLDKQWQVTEWEELTDEDLRGWLKAAQEARTCGLVNFSPD